MKRTAVFLPAMVVLLAAGVGLVAGAQPSAQDIVERADDLMRGQTSYTEMTMAITTAHYRREVQMKAWTEGREKAFILVTAPARDAGVTFLKLGREMWNYLPSVERTIKIPPSMMLQSWMGSNFTNDDLARADSFIVDYDHRITGEETIDSAPCWQIELTPKPNAPVVWGKVVLVVMQDGYVGRRVEYYDEDMQLAKVMVTDRLVTASGRKVASHMVMINKKKPGNQTEVTYGIIKFDVAIPADTFTTRNLTRGVR